MEEVKEKCGLSLTNDKVYMNTTFKAFTEAMVLNSRGEDSEEQFSYTPVSVISDSCCKENHRNVLTIIL